MRLVDLGLEALIAPSGHATPWSGLAALGAAVAGLAVLGMAAKDNPLFGLPTTDAYDVVQPNALVLRAFREAQNTTPDVGWGRPFGEWSPAEVAVFMDWVQDRGLDATMDYNAFYAPLAGQHVQCKELNTPIYYPTDPSDPEPTHFGHQIVGYWTEWRLDNGAQRRVDALDDEQTIAALADAYGLEGDIPRGSPDAKVGTSLMGATIACVNTREPLRAIDESNGTMLERARGRAPVLSAFLDYRMRELIKDRKAT